jgi:hypothetical protein
MIGPVIIFQIEPHPRLAKELHFRKSYQHRSGFPQHIPAFDTAHFSILKSKIVFDRSPRTHPANKIKKDTSYETITQNANT